MGNHTALTRKSRHSRFLDPFWTLISAFLGAAGKIVRTGQHYRPETLLILDDDRRLNAQRFDDFFYRHQGAEPEMPHQTAQPIPENSAVDADAAAALTKLLANPSMAELIKNLAKNL